MGSDLARVSYDPTRKWRGLVAQQGRVTVEADWNEAAAIEAAGDRAVTLNVVGPVGSPDGGYTVTATPPASPLNSGSMPGSAQGDLSVNPGTLYLGGERLDLEAAVDLANQPDWLDQPDWFDQPDWRDPATGILWTAPDPLLGSSQSGTPNELVYLLAIEQEVSALEDPALADVALGGPDTMQRLRVLQRFVRWPTQATSCEQAWSEVQKAWAGIGLNLDPTSMRLESTAALQVGFVPVQASADPCQPAATNGYLGAENQLIRVQIASVDADGVPTIVWGFDDATFLYEVTPVDPESSPLVLTLAAAPVDSYHNPVATQAVELLRAAASLTPDDPASATADGFIAAAAGPVFSVQGYDSSSRTVTIAGSLPAGYQAPNQLYLRVWQGSMTASEGTPVTLTGAGATTGVTVTLSSPSDGFHPGDFWRFALRPSNPNLIYPARYLVEAQPPDGARVLACPVALVNWAAAGSPAVTSCIPAFDNLVEVTARAGGGCCTVNVTPEDAAATSLNALLHTLLGANTDGRGSMTVCFASGDYTLTEPLVFDQTFINLSLEGCGGPVRFTAPANPGTQFLLGLIVLQGPSAVTIRGIELMQPLVSFAPSQNPFAGLPGDLPAMLGPFANNLLVGIGISAHDTPDLLVESCTFLLSTSEALTSNIFAAGIFASGSLREPTVRGCTFGTDPEPSTVPFYDLASLTQPQPPFPYLLSFGYLQAPVTPTQDSPPSPPAGYVMDLLDDATIESCRFQGLTVSVFALDLLGAIRVERNTVQDCYAGIWLLSMSQATPPLVLKISLTEPIVGLVLGIAGVLPATPPVGPHLIGQPIQPLDPATTAILRVTLAGNQIDAILPGSSPDAGPWSGVALVVEDLTSSDDESGYSPYSPGSSALITANRIRNISPQNLNAVLTIGITAYIGLANATVTGNIIANEVANPPPGTTTLPPAGSLSVVNNAAIVGNVFINSPNLPSHVDPSPDTSGQPLPAWRTYNTVSNMPQVTGFSPTKGPEAGKTPVTITGSGFLGDGTYVRFGATREASRPDLGTDSDIQITVTTPAGTGAVDVTVITPAGTASGAELFTYTP